MKVRDRFFNFMLKGLKYKDALMKSTNRPLIRSLGRKLVDPAWVSLTYIPVAEQLEIPSGTPLPASIVEGFIEQASHRVILHRCPCRAVNECADFPRDFGCTFLGDAARDIDPDVGKQVSKEEALDHYRRAREMGLVSVVGNSRATPWPWG